MGTGPITGNGNSHAHRVKKNSSRNKNWSSIHNHMDLPKIDIDV